MGRFHELEAAALHERDVVPRQLDLEIEGVEARAEQHRHVPQGNALLPQLQYALAHEARLGVLALRLYQERRLTVALAAVEVLLVALHRPGDDLVGESQNRLGAAVVLLQGNDRRSRKLVGKVHDVPEVGAAERVDALGVVAHGHDVVVGTGQAADDVGLQAVGVLVLVHHDEAKALRQPVPQVLLRVQKILEAGEQIVVVQQRLLAFVDLVTLGDGHQLLQEIREVRVLAFDQLGEGHLLVARQALDLRDGLLSGKALLPDVEAHLCAQELDHVLAVGTVHDGEARRQSHELAVLPQHHVAEGVEGPAGDALATGVGQQARALQHLLRRPAGEGEQQDRSGIDAPFDQAGDPIHERPGLSRTGPGHHQQRTFQEHRGFTLRLVELVLVGDGGCGRGRSGVDVLEDVFARQTFLQVSPGWLPDCSRRWPAPAVCRSRTRLTQPAFPAKICCCKPAGKELNKRGIHGNAGPSVLSG